MSSIVKGYQLFQFIWYCEMSRTTLPIWEGAGKKADMCFFTCWFCQHNPVPPCWSWLIFFNFGFTEKIANKKIIFFCVFKKRNFLGRAEKINKLVKKNRGFLTRGLKQQETWSFFAQKSEVNEVHKYFLLILSNWHLVGSTRKRLVQLTKYSGVSFGRNLSHIFSTALCTKSNTVRYTSVERYIGHIGI